MVRLTPALGPSLLLLGWSRCSSSRPASPPPWRQAPRREHELLHTRGNETRSSASLHQLRGLLSGTWYEQIGVELGPREGAHSWSQATSIPRPILPRMCCRARRVPWEPWASSSPMCKVRGPDLMTPKGLSPVYGILGIYNLGII